LLFAGQQRGEDESPLVRSVNQPLDPVLHHPQRSEDLKLHCEPPPIRPGPERPRSIENDTLVIHTVHSGTETTVAVTANSGPPRYTVSCC
jgi:hypothetical protein